MPSTARLLRQQIGLLMETVPDVGRVHEYGRLVTDWAQYLDLFKVTLSTGKTLVRGWVITRGQATGYVSLVGQTDTLFAFRMQARPYVFKLTGFSALQDATATELEWEDTVEAVQDVLDQEIDLGGLTMVGGVGPSLLTVWDERQLGSVLCHFVEVLLPVIVPRDVP